MRRPRGFTVLESIVAGGLMMSLFMLAGLMATSSRHMDYATGQTVASELLSRQLDALRLMRFEDVPPGTFDGRIPSAAVATANSGLYPPGPYPRENHLIATSRERSVRTYRLQVNCQAGSMADGSPLLRLKIVRVTVEWNEGGAVRRIQGYTGLYDARSVL